MRKTIIFGSVLALIGVVPPLSIFETRHLLRDVRVVPFPATNFIRHLHLFPRIGELDTTAMRIAAMARQILRDRYVPELLEIAGWLKDQIVVDDG